ncbi:chaperone NapD [Helicobacter cetorum]|uniref:NapD n=1 Tax=Helicobacter cetorum (strain ATCC BAA-540 / CCUG 52418 / MIT 99-5656) TaxID=1163745 RepID=I0ET56_HELCM|nr:chaperone NapD [Helicobacter cetorum]AFI06125.1 NapD [Helicobacter cetorum MIT 99-5656]
MNVSSVVIECEFKNLECLKAKIKAIPFCSVELEKDCQLIVVIESENLEDELKAYKSLENLKEVIQIHMAFSYQNLELEREKAEHSNALERIESTEQAQDFCYYGDIYKRY